MSPLPHLNLLTLRKGGGHWLWHLVPAGAARLYHDRAESGGGRQSIEVQWRACHSPPFSALPDGPRISCGDDLEPPSNTGHILRELGAKLGEQGALLGLDLISSHVRYEYRQEQGRAGI
jgi:hypothetical protein